VKKERKLFLWFEYMLLDNGKRKEKKEKRKKGRARKSKLRWFEYMLLDS